MKIRSALLIVSLLQVAVVAFVILNSSREAWRVHQLEYYDLALGRASNPATQAAIAASGLEIKQDVLSGFGEETRVDRCRTCHAAIDDVAFADGKEPLRAHPPIPEHAFGEFGCTICHQGNGRALTAKFAHGKDSYWPEPLLRGPYIEASCARCHPAPYLDETPHLRHGRELFDRYACSGCHTIRGFSRGKLGPDLSEVGKRFGLEYLHESITDPKANAPLSLMPTFSMPEEDRIAIVVFLKSLQGRTLVEDPMTLRVATRRWKEQRPTEIPLTVKSGNEAFDRRGCVACHKLGERDGGLAPDLGHLGLIRDASYVAAHLADPRAHTSGSNMPTFWMSKSERQAIALYLTSLASFARPDTPAAQYETLCARCHGKEGRGDGVAAANLLPQPRDFTNTKYFRWLPEERSRRAILRGVPGTAMPPFDRILSEEQASALFAWIRSRFLPGDRAPSTKPRRVPEVNPVAYSEESAERGARVFEKRCYGCHGRRGDGKGPNAPGMIPRPRDLTSKAFFTEVSDSRIFESLTYGVVGTGMPPWDVLPETERWDLVSFVRRLSGTGPAAPTNSKEGGSNG